MTMVRSGEWRFPFGRLAGTIAKLSSRSRRARCWIPATLVVFSVVLFSICARADDFIAGADFSLLKFFEDRGIVYKDNGQTTDGLVILGNHGVNCVRLRLFTSSTAQAAADPYNYINNLDYTVPLAVRVKNAGLRLLLDFHYSDTWADPGTQTKPSAWTNLNFVDLVLQLRLYTSNSIATLRTAGAMPDYVQVGNEITSGMLWPDGHVSGSNNQSWTNLVTLLKAAINGVHDGAGTNQPKIIIHIDRGGDWPTTQWFFDNVTVQQVPFDIIGESYYPFWHGSLTSLRACLSNTAARFNKPVIVAETAFPWNGTTNIYGIPPTTNGQVQFATALSEILRSVTNGLGIGVFWWGTEYQTLSGYNLAGFDKRSFFASPAGFVTLPPGNVFPVADAWGGLAAPVVISATVATNKLTLAWPLSGAGMSLKTATNLQGNAAWSAVTNAVQTTGAIYRVTLPVDIVQNHFFRLQSK